MMFEASPRWSGTDEKDMIEHLMPFRMDTYFKRENSLIIDNKPVLFVFGIWKLFVKSSPSATIFPIIACRRISVSPATTKPGVRRIFPRYAGKNSI